MGWREAVDKYQKRDPETLSKHLPQDVSNGKFGNEERITNGRKEQRNKEQKHRMSKTVVVNIEDAGISTKFHQNGMLRMMVKRKKTRDSAMNVKGYKLKKLQSLLLSD
jgi:hypothetical protein